ncbi:hypothetical protein [Lysinibacillus sp. FSL K6-0102]|uniref:hypothetical protein n=1 Tax=Lysinibacillus sp. FSL K6-0102 TaxID=2975290 RepID=UPI0030FC2333
MARKVKCTYCKKDGTNESFHKEVIKGRNKYFCNQIEYELFEMNEAKKQTETEERNSLMKWIMDEIYNYETGMVFPKTLNGRVSKLLNFYPVSVVKEAFVNNYEVLSWAIKNKDFTSEFHATCYVMTIVEGSVNDIYLEFKRNQKQIDRVSEKSVDVQLFDEVSNTTVINNTNKKDISHFLEDDF